MTRIAVMALVVVVMVEPQVSPENLEEVAY